MPNQEVMLAKLTRREFETSLALALFPENIRYDAMHDQMEKDPLEAPAEKGRLFAQEAVRAGCGIRAGDDGGKDSTAGIKTLSVKNLASLSLLLRFQ